MPDQSKLSLLLFAFLFPPARAQASSCSYGSTPELVFSPTNPTLNPDTPFREVVITCRHPPGQRTASSLALNWTSDSSASSTRLVRANKDAMVNLGVVPGSKMNGTFTTAIAFTIPHVSCTTFDGGTFICESVSTPHASSSPVTCLQAARLSPHSESSDIWLRAQPDWDTYSVGDTLTLTCRATEGLTTEIAGAEWVWEKKKDGENWTTVTENAYLGSLSTVNDCFKVRTTVLKLILDLTHNGLTYRCYTIKYGKALISAARSYSLNVESFIFGLKTSLGALVLFDIIIIVLSAAAAGFVAGKTYSRRRKSEQEKSGA